MDIKDLFYKPDIQPTRDYRSDGVILQEEPDNSIQVEQKQQLNDIEEAYIRNVETIERLLRIRQVTPLLPSKIVETINQILDIVITGAWLDNEDSIRTIIEEDGGYIYIPPEKEEEEIEDIWHPDETKEEKVTIYTKKEEEPEQQTESEQETDEVQTSSSQNADEWDWPELTSSGYELEIEENKNIWDYSNDQYLVDQSLIREAFSKEYNDIIEPYIYQLLTAMDEAGVTSPESLNFEYEGETVTGVSEDNQHLNDIIVRNQIALNEMSDMFAKTHDLNQTSATLSSYDVIAQERTRYFKEKYNEAAAQNYIDMYDKNLLAAARREYTAKYTAARANTYKFLHSAVAISESMLALALASNLAKCSLIKKGVNIFAKKEYKNESVSNSTSTDKQEKSNTNENKATDTVKSENKENSLDQLKIDDNYGGTSKASQDKTKEAASGTIKTTAENDKVRVRVAAAVKNNKEK